MLFRSISLLRRIQELTNEGVSLAGVQRILALEAELEAARDRIARLESHLEATRREADEQIAAVHRQYRHDIVPFRPNPIVRLR